MMCADVHQFGAVARLSVVQVGLAALSRVLGQNAAVTGCSILAVAGFRWSSALKPALRRSRFFEEVLASGEGHGEAAAGSRPLQPSASMSMPEVSFCRVNSMHTGLSAHHWTYRCLLSQNPCNLNQVLTSDMVTPYMLSCSPCPAAESAESLHLGGMPPQSCLALHTVTYQRKPKLTETQIVSICSALSRCSPSCGGSLRR